MRARTLYEECLEICRPFRDATERVTRIQMNLSRLEEAKKLEKERRERGGSPATRERSKAPVI